MVKLFLWILALITLTSLTLGLELPSNVVNLYSYYESLAQNVTFLVAFVAGVVTFTSSCGFVVLPTFLSVVFKERKRAQLMATAFALGLTLAFTLFGILAGIIGNFFNQYKTTFAFISGFVLVFFGILLFLNKGFSLFYFKVDHSPKKSFFSIFSLGFFFAVGWTPCIGPVLSSIMLLAANTGTLLKSTLFFITYSLGIVTPLLAIAFVADKYDLANSPWIRGKLLSFTLFKKRITTHTYNIVGGSILLIVGSIMILYQGTTFFQSTIPRLFWSMEIYNAVNEVLLETPLLHTTGANVLGLLILVGILFLFVRTLYSRVSSR